VASIAAVVVAFFILRASWSRPNGGHHRGGFGRSSMHRWRPLPAFGRRTIAQTCSTERGLFSSWRGRSSSASGLRELATAAHVLGMWNILRHPLNCFGNW